MASLLDENIKKQIKEMFSEMEKPVEIVFFGSQDEACEYCEQTLALVKEVVTTSTHSTWNDTRCCMERPAPVLDSTRKLGMPRVRPKCRWHSRLSLWAPL